MDRNGTFTPQIVAPHQRRFSPKPLLPGRHLRHRQPALTTECHYTLPHCSCSDTSPLNFAAFCSTLSPIKLTPSPPSAKMRFTYRSLKVSITSIRHRRCRARSQAPRGTAFFPLVIG